MSTLGLCIAVGLLAFGETAVLLDLFVPGEVGLVLAGAAAAAGDHPTALIAAAAAIGAFAGDTTSYAIGRHWGRGLLDRFGLLRRRLSSAVERAEDHFERHGGRSVFIARWIGALRAVVPFVAGVSRLAVASFLAWNAAASLLWAGTVVVAGALLGRHIASTVDRIGTVISIVAIAAIAGVFLWRQVRSKRD